MTAEEAEAMRRGRAALEDAKNELIRAGIGSDAMITELRHAENDLATCLEAHAEAQPSTTP